MEHEIEVELVADHNGYRLLGTHAGCATCEANAYTAYGYASSWASTAHSHTSNDDTSGYHQGIARLIDVG